MEPVDGRERWALSLRESLHHLLLAQLIVRDMRSVVLKRQPGSSARGTQVGDDLRQAGRVVRREQAVLAIVSVLRAGRGRSKEHATSS